MVLHDSEPGHSITTSSTSRPRSPPSRSDLSPRAEQATADRLEIERAHLAALGLSDTVVDTMLASRRQSTNRIYGYTWRVFSRWCAAHTQDPLTALVKSILEFLQDSLKKALRPATLRRQVAALDSIHSLRSNPPPLQSLARHPLIQKFVRGACSLSPGTKHRFPSWKLHTVLRALMGPPFKLMGTVDLKWVKQKKHLFSGYHLGPQDL